MNHITLIGRLTKDPIYATTNNGEHNTKFTLAVDDGKDKNGEKKTQFINCVAWAQTAEFISRYVHKGERLAVEGRLTNRSYDDKDGKKQYITEVVVSRSELLTDKPKDEPKDEPKFNTGKPVDIESDDLPF